MSVALTIAGQTFNYPSTADDNWGTDATNWATAVSTNLLQRTGGTFSLTNDVNFGASFATIQIYLKSRTANIASAGFVRMAVSDLIEWRNNANSGNNTLGVNGSDDLVYNGNTVITSGGAGGTVPVSQGGTGITSYTAGDTLYASGSTTLSKLGIGTSGYLLTSSGSAPQWSQFLAKDNGGTGASNASVTFPSSGVIVTEAGTETLTNKTLTSPTITGATLTTATLTSPNVNGIYNAVKATQTSDYTATTSDYLIPCDCTSAGLTISLPASSGKTGLTYVIRKIDSSFNQVTIDPNSTETIDGSLTATLNTQWEAVTIICDGTGWQIADRKILSGWVAYTPTLSNVGTATNVAGLWKRNGGSIEIIAGFTTGTTVASAFACSLPSGLSTSSALPTTPTYTVVGSLISGGTGAVSLYAIATGSASTFTASFQSSTQASTSPVNGTDLGNANNISIHAFIPITNWNA